MKHIKLVVLLCCAMLLCSQTAFAYKYSIEDYTHYTGDRLEARMPEAFSVNQLPHQVIVNEDFEDNTFNELSYVSGTYTLENGALKVVKTKTDTFHSVVFNVKKGSNVYTAGDYYVFSCRIKFGDDFTGGKVRNLITAYSNATPSKWLTEAGNNKLEKADDWTELYQILKLPANTGLLKLCTYIDTFTATGTVWYDDFKLYRVMADPMRSVLRKPAYKGYVYGDGFGDIDLGIFVNEYLGFYAYEDMILEADLINEQGTVLKSSVAETVSQRMNMCFSSNGLAEGDYYVTVRLKGKDGALLAEQEHTVRKRAADYRPDTYVDENGHLIQNGEKVFLRQVLTGGLSAYGNDAYGAILERLKSLGIDSANHQGSGWWLVPGETERAALEGFRAADKQLALKLVTLIMDPNDAAFKPLIKEPWHGRSLVTLAAEDYRDDPVLGGYYIFDEVNPVIDGKLVSWYNDILADVDPDHVTFGAADKNYGDYAMYTSMVDIVYQDPYPVWGRESDNIAIVGKNAKNLKENFPNRPIGLMMQAFNWADVGRDAERPPTYEEMRNMLFQALTEGTEHIDAYSLGEMEFGTGKTWEEWQTEIRSLYAETRTYEDILLSDEPAPRYYLAEESWLNECVRRANGKTYLFAVNNSKIAQQTTVTIPGATACKTAEGGTSLAIDDGSVLLSFAPLEVKILEFTQADYVSPEAELKQMGFFNCSHVYPVAEGTSNTLYITDDSVIINYCADISDGATLYIDGSFKENRGKINVKNATEFTVSVVSADKKTTTTKHYTVCRES